MTVLTTSAFGEPAPSADVEVARTFDLQRVRARLRGGDRVDSMFDADSYSGRPHPLSHVLVPEPLIAAWAPFALLSARRLLSHRPPDCVITTSPPESSHLVGRMLSRRGIPWIADLRDGWNFERLRPRFPTAVQRRLDERFERRWLAAADLVSCVSQPVADDLRARRIADPIVVPNGWDADSSDPAPVEAPSLDPARVSLVYTGRFGSYGRDPSSLVEALARLAQQEPAAAKRLELAIAGPLTESERLLFARDVAPARVSLLGSIERASALALQQSADALLVLASPKRSQLANLKLYEYLAAGRPILALAAGTEAGRITGEAGCTVVRSDDVPAIQSALRELAESGLAPPDPESRERYTYPAVADQMADAVELAIERGTRAV